MMAGRHYTTQNGRKAPADSKPTLSHNNNADCANGYEDTKHVKTENCDPQISLSHGKIPHSERKPVKDSVSRPFLKSIPPKMIYISTTVLGVLCAVSVYQSYSNLPSNLPDTRLVELLEKHGYSRDEHVRVKKYEYGSPDLLSDDSIQKLADRWSQKDAHRSEDFVESGVPEEGKKDEEGGLKGADVNWGMEKRYVVVFDAGSTGTRLHVFTFQYENGGIKLKNEVFENIKPGLSEFVNAPEKGAATLQPMIDAAMRKVPAPLHSSTPLVFKATAGFRLLEPTGANRLLMQIRERFAQTDFLYKPEDISIMSSTEEGLYAWITINYLTGKLDGDSLTAATLDLGGASMQLTYQPLDQKSFTGQLQQLELMASLYSLYTQSYLGVGLLAARNSTFLKREDGVFTGDCLPAGFSGVFTFGGQSFPVRGPDSPSIDRCWQQVGEFLSTTHIRRPWDLVGKQQGSDFYLISYFHEILTWAGIWRDDDTEKIMTVQDFYNASYTACKAQSHEFPFLCQDLTYITRLLGEGFMLWDIPLHVVKEINSMETSWALGAALKELSRT